MRLRRVLAAAGVAAVAGAASWFVAATPDRAGARVDQTPIETSTATVTRRDLVERKTATGRLSYADLRTVSTRRSGTVTWLPEEGATLARGAWLATIDARPVFFFSGATPAWRPMRRGDEGQDVRQLQQNLIALGHGSGVAVDGTFDAATERAVERWQDAQGLTETGVVELGDVVFLPGEQRRAGARQASVGEPAGGPLLQTTSTQRIVTVSLSADQQTAAVKGAAVQVDLPGGTRVQGTIDRVGTVAKAAAEGGSPTVDVTVVLDAKSVPPLDGAPVSVRFARSTKKGVLTVPVTALLARTGGSYALEPAAGGALIPVEIGLIADGFVEVSGPGLIEGLDVVVPA